VPRRFPALLTGAVVAVLVMLASSAATAPAQSDFLPLTTRQLEQTVGQVTFRVFGLGCGLVMRQGSAVALADGRTLTDRHVVERTVGLDVAPDIGPVSPATSAVSMRDDVAEVQSAVPRSSTIRLAANDPRPGSTVTVAGYPDADGLAVVTTRVVDYVDGRPRGQPGDLMRVRTEPVAGMSGGPVLDAAGHLAGLVYAAEQSSGYGLVIPASALRRALQEGLVGLPARC
jgi:hypothetical protein